MSHLVCPACRDHDTGPAPLTRSPASLDCPRCRATYPVAAAPVVAHPLPAFLRAIQDDLAAPPPALAARVVPFLPDDTPLARRLARVSVAARSHYGDLLNDGSISSWDTFRSLLEELPAGDVVELGCGAGRIALELAGPKRNVVALDTDPAVIALGQQLKDHGRAEVAIRDLGAAYVVRRIEAPRLQGRPVEFVLADATQPPLPAEAFAAVVALNLLDNVRVPSVLIGQIDALLKPGGLAVLTTPYAWDSQHVDDGERVGGAPGRPFGGVPEDELRRLLSGDGLPWKFELVREERALEWTLVRDRRCRFVYALDALVIRKVA
jgi:SAM-dependent methyltransferase